MNGWVDEKYWRRNTKRESPQRETHPNQIYDAANIHVGGVYTLCIERPDQRGVFTSYVSIDRKDQKTLSVNHPNGRWSPQQRPLEDFGLIRTSEGKWKNNCWLTPSYTANGD